MPRVLRVIVTFLLVLSRITFLQAWTTTSLSTFVSYCRRSSMGNHRQCAESFCAKKRTCSTLFASDNNNNKKNGGADEFFSLDPEDKPKNGGDTPKLGIDLGPMLDPLTEKEAAELKAAATEIINDSIAEGLDEIEKLRERMKREFERKKVSMAAASERNTARESAKLMSKIDALTDAFLENTELSRKATKLAAAADQAMEGKGVDLGAWGNLGGATVTTGSLLGSVENAQQQAAKHAIKSKSTGESTGAVETVQEQSNRIIVLADPSQDQYAKQLIDPLTAELQKSLPSLQVEVYKPTATLPIGGNNAACALIFCGSFSDKSSVYKAMDRILRKTLQPGGAIGQPPTQLVAISTIGTERTNKMPYSLQNLMGGKLDQRRQIEESLINIVRQRAVDPALDYTICKFGELKEGSVSEPFQLAFGDVLDGSTATDTAVTVLSQAIAFQPSARNTTLCCVGSLAESVKNQQDFLDDAFLKLDGPELLRTELVTSSDKADANFEPLAEYMREWADLLATSGKGLTTPIRAEVVSVSGRIPGVTKAASVKLLFLPTATGKNYLSRDEEKQREKQGSSSTKPPPLKKAPREGGIEVLVEKTKEGALRVRAKRCNYAEDAVIKELSEETILSRLRQSIDVWLKDHQIR